jgi:hypothetical protein
MRVLLVLLAACTAAPAAPTKQASVRQLVWNLEPNHSTGRIGPTSVSWTDGGKVVWTAPLPQGLRFSVVDDAKARAWLMKQRDDDGYAKYWAIAMLDDAIALEDGGDLVVLELANGHTRFTFHVDDQHRFDDALFDSGDIDVAGPDAEHCSLHVAQHQSFVVGCGRGLVFFDHGVLALLDAASGRELGRTEWHGPGLDDLEGRCPGERKKQVDSTRTLAGWTVRARGLRLTVCED